MHTKLLVAAVLLFQLSASVPLDQGTGLLQRHDEPCNQVREHVAKWMSDNDIVPKNYTDFVEQVFFPTVPAAPIRPSVAFACLKSAPLHKDTGLAQLDFLRPLLEWQSTLDYLRDPPQGYLSEGVDLNRGLDDMAAKLKKGNSGGYANEFEYLADLYTLITVRPRDFHLTYSTLLMELFDFPMKAQFVAISEDGLAMPKVYLHDDIHYAQHGYTPSPVSTIDGVPAMEFLQKASVNNGAAHDPDARFNSLFRSLALDANVFHFPPESFALGLRDTTIVKCGNGTKVEFSNDAFVRANLTNIASGDDLYDSFGPGTSTGPSTKFSQFYTAIERNFTGHFVGHPEPLNTTASRNIAGFLPDGPGLSDAAVLAVHNFQGSLDPRLSGPLLAVTADESYNVTVDFLRAAKAANRTKLVLDVQGNGGGWGDILHMLYLSLFPGEIPFPLLYQARAHPQFAWIAENGWDQSMAMGESLFPVAAMAKPDGTPWETVQELYGPYKDISGRGEYTHPTVNDYTRVMHNFIALNREVPPWKEPPFKPEDIIIVTDGLCGSSCAMLVEALVHNHDVRTVALGGRPMQAPMQAIGQVKAGPVVPFRNMMSVNMTGAPDDIEFPPPLTGYSPPLRMNTPDEVGWGSGISFNAANAMLPGEPAGSVPLQFRYEAANCKLFYTWDMARDITAVWKAAAGVAWEGAKCVPGSTTNADGTMGGVPEYSKEVEDKYRLGAGPGAVGKK